MEGMEDSRSAGSIVPPLFFFLSFIFNPGSSFSFFLSTVSMVSKRNKSPDTPLIQSHRYNYILYNTHMSYSNNGSSCFAHVCTMTLFALSTFLFSCLLVLWYFVLSTHWSEQ
ncbi:MAG: hypothetical protein JOS17DRAFT_73728 [Linnemannia elongata]|nr:MAG: hypothetical protein JOS17DRAFT_73728 [Linnemannia elongata]